MKYLIAVLTLVLIGLAGCGMATGVTRGSGNVITESRPVSNITGVNLAGVGALNITQGDTESLTIQADDNLMPFITTTVQDGTLVIGIDTSKGAVTLSPSTPIKYELQVKTLDSILVSGAGSIQAPALKSDVLTVTTSGAGNIYLPSVEAASLTAGISGAGNMSLAGQVESQQVLLSGLGNYSAGELKSTNAAVNISGAGSADVWVTDTLNARINGAGSINYFGSPKVTPVLSGAGSIQSLGPKP